MELDDGVWRSFLKLQRFWGCDKVISCLQIETCKFYPRHENWDHTLQKILPHWDVIVMRKDCPNHTRSANLYTVQCFQLQLWLEPYQGHGSWLLYMIVFLNSETIGVQATGIFKLAEADPEILRRSLNLEGTVSVHCSSNQTIWAIKYKSSKMGRLGHVALLVVLLAASGSSITLETCKQFAQYGATLGGSQDCTVAGTLKDLGCFWWDPITNTLLKPTQHT